MIEFLGFILPKCLQYIEIEIRFTLPSLDVEKGWELMNHDSTSWYIKGFGVYSHGNLGTNIWKHKAFLTGFFSQS